LVTGSRTITNKQWIESILQQYDFEILVIGIDYNTIKHHQTQEKLQQKKILSVDDYAFLYAKQHTKQIISLVPNWIKLKNSAGVVRNSQMVEILETNDDIGIALWDGKSKGTFQCFQLLRQEKKLDNIYVYKIKTLLDLLK
ncbi:MAG: hypothetical protein WC934_06815, partial [Acidithiobacillus sp.]|jgi:hypothetical protein|uniref:hypothetical protein n=1 Tax=Acidithiobacillus sp. TaxID=1872118 RepID=UPI00355CEF2B